jgi:hypothetical protein
MIRLKLEESPRAVQEFMRNLARKPEVIEIEDRGQLLLRILATPQSAEDQKPALLKEGRSLVRRARDRNKGMPARTLEKEIRVAVEAVRAKGR